MRAKITWSFVNSISWKKRCLMTLWSESQCHNLCRKLEKFKQKCDATNSSLKRLGKAQKKMDVAASRGFPLCKTLQYDLKETAPYLMKLGWQGIKTWNIETVGKWPQRGRLQIELKWWSETLCGCRSHVYNQKSSNFIFIKT